MRGEQANIILSSIHIKCPLCKKYRARTRTTMRQHLHQKHTINEAQKYINSILSIKL